MRRLQEEIESVFKTRISFLKFQKVFLKLGEPCSLRVRKGHRFGPAYLTHNDLNAHHVTSSLSQSGSLEEEIR